MSSDPRKAPVRIRVRTMPSADEGGTRERLIADPAPAVRRKRQPNSGSMKPGETRNPHGRPKGAKGTRAMVSKVLGTRTTIRENGRPKTVSIYEAMLRKELQLASEGDWRARKTILELGRWAFADDTSGSPVAPGTAPAAERTATDEAIIAWFEEEVGRRRGDGGCQ